MLKGKETVFTSTEMCANNVWLMEVMEKLGRISQSPTWRWPTNRRKMSPTDQWCRCTSHWAHSKIRKSNVEFSETSQLSVLMIQSQTLVLILSSGRQQVFFFFYSRTILTLHRFVVTAGSDESDWSSWRRRINLICEKEAFQGLNSSCSHFLRPALQPPVSGEDDKWFYQADRGELSAPGWSGIKIITNIITWMSWRTDSSCQHGWSYQHLFILYLRRTTWRSCYLFKILGFLCDENVQTPKTKSLKLQNVPLNNHKSSKQSHRTVET